jgi:4-diphosphocytidyl-2-C-methyl-D-erythritol kinase
MIVFPNAKINLGLFVTSKRSDGYHNLETIFVPIKGFCDILEVLTNTAMTEDQFANSGLLIDGKPENNLCLKALRLMREHADIPPLNIHLHKIIPFGAGLGGGSADAAFMLTLLNEQYKAGLSNDELESLASQIGADCAVFIRNQTVLAKGIGNEFEPVNEFLTDLNILLVIPPVHVPTALAYKNITPMKPVTPLKELIQSPINQWNKSIFNDFEESVFKNYPEIETIKKTLYKNGALYASMSGSGSAVYGIFKEKTELIWKKEYTVFSGKL